MSAEDYRVERDSLGEVRVPKDALYGAQTQRAVENFPVSDLRFPRGMIRALGMIKGAAAAVNQELGLMDRDMSLAIQAAAKVSRRGRARQPVPSGHFPDRFRYQHQYERK